jgi:hypothetical protein
MAIDLVQLRVAAALAHSLPTAALELQFGGRHQTMYVGREAATVPWESPCTFRQQLLARLREHPCAPEWLDWVTEAIVGGNAVVHLGADLFRSTMDGWEVDCFVTLLHYDLVVDVLTEISRHPVGHVDRTAVLLPDRELAVTVVMLSRPEGLSDELLLSSARDAQAGCLVAEVTRALAID